MSIQDVSVAMSRMSVSQIQVNGKASFGSSIDIDKLDLLLKIVCAGDSH